MTDLILSESAARQGSLILVNDAHPLAASPDGGALTPFTPAQPTLLLHRQAVAPLRLLIEAAGGEESIAAVSGYRPLREQQQIWDDSMAENGPAFTRQYVARPGCSEHQTGLAIDLGERRPVIDFIRPAFPDSGACGRFRALAPRYGFVERYRAGKEAVTGIAAEPWHFRYVGFPHSLLMAERGLALEEYIALLRAGTTPDRPLCCQSAGGRFAVCYLPAGGTAELDLPNQTVYSLSGTNEGGFVLCVWGAEEIALRPAG